jgi:cysteine dioxygenase
MNADNPHLTLEEFILEMGRRPVSSLTQERLMDFTRRLIISDELIESRTCFAPNTYTRNLVCRSADFELLVLCWKPGHESTIHDHAGSLNAIRVHRGELTSRLFVPAAGSPVGTGPVELVAEERVQVDGWTGVDRSGVHQLANTSGGNLVTVHVYAPPLLELTVFSTDSADVERRPLRHTLADDMA